MSTTLRALRPRVGRLDLALTIFVCGLGLLLAYSNYTDAPDNPASEGGPFSVSVWAIPLFLLITLPMLWRSSRPLLALVAVSAAVLIHQALFGSIVRCGAAYPTIALLAYSAGCRLEGRDRALALGAAVVAAVLTSVCDFLGVATLMVGLPVVAASFGAGRIAASRRRAATRLREQTAELQVARDERARLEVATDRADLSSELDSLLRHRLRDLAALADQGPASVEDGTAAAVLADIEAESRATLEEMRSLVGALRGEDGGVVTAPMPTLTSLEALVVRTRGAGSRVVIEGDPRVLPPGVELSAYRIIEHLLGALDDAPGVEVRVGFRPDALELHVQGQARHRAELASGIARARERAELHRGTLRTHTSGGRAETTATLPMLQGI